MRKPSDLHHMLTRRALVIGGVQSVAVAGLFSRLYYLQFLKSDSYKTRAEDNRIRTQLVAPSRGLILDRHRVPLAKNLPSYRLRIEQGRERKSRQHTLTKVAGLLKLPHADYIKLKQELADTPLGQSIIIQKQMQWEQIATLEFHTPDLPGMVIEHYENRHYPLADAGAHLLGYVGAVSKADIKPDQPVLKLPGFKIGKNGVEKSRDAMLRGTAGVQHLEVNANGLVLRDLGRVESIAGSRPLLGIDHRLQQFCHQRLGDEAGAIVVMDAQKGDVLALASTPSFDPNVFSTGITHTYWNALRENPKVPLMNKAITGQYPPGSTFKMIVALAGLEAGIINGNTHVHCPGHYTINRHTFNCWKQGGHGSVNVASALAESCDTFFYTVGAKLGIDRIVAMAKRFGYGETLGIGIPSEKTGLTPSDAWKRKRHGEPWQAGDTVNSAIGQGFMLATPLQLAVMAARIATGREVMPRLFLDAPETIKPADDLGLNPAHLALVQKGMWQVVNARNGTAYGKRLEDPAQMMVGKTGTSQVRRITKRGVKQSTLPWEERHHALFVAYAPFDAPKYALSVIIEHGGGGSSAAAPVAKDVMLECFRLAGEPVPETQKEELQPHTSKTEEKA